MKYFLVAAAVLFSTVQAWSLVDLKNANYAEGYIDLNIPGSGYDLKIERTYNSRTIFNGMFGFGWCSDFETSIEITSEGALKLTECGAGYETTFVPKNFSKKDVDKTVMQIIAKVHESNKTAPGSYFKTLEEELRTKDYMRYEYAAKYGISVGAVADGMKFYADGKDVDVIEKKGEFYIRALPDNTIEKFNLKGKLAKLFDKNGNYVELAWDGNRLKTIVDNNGRKLTFGHYDNGKVRSIVGPNNMKVEYQFKDLNNLVYARAASGNIYKYEYDDLHNLTKIIYPDKTAKEMTYNKDQDWVTSFKDRDGCLETYTYEQSNDDSKNHFWSRVNRKCGGKQISNAKYEFWYKKRDDGAGMYLARHVTSEGDQVADITYNELGKPLAIVRNKKATKFDYYANGLLKKKVTPDGQVTNLFYEPTLKKVSKVERGGKSTEFFYDTKGNLIKAVNSDGQKVTLQYDGRGRIVALEDQAKRLVTIRYEEKFGKPSYIERKGVGAINVIYDVHGEVAKVTSAAGSSVAIQVASAFSNLLELLQPAGVNLSF